ncbi:MAG: phosphate ABC transporter ATP-binding protein [Nitriliruptoraceae bacterium]
MAAPLLALRRLRVLRGGRPVLAEVDLDIPAGRITAVIGPSGSGKTSLLRTLNRTLELEPGTEISGRVSYHGEDLYASPVDPVVVRQHLGLVGERPAPFAGSIRHNVAFGLRLRGRRRGLDAAVERALRRAGLWEEVRDDLTRDARVLSAGQQQRLCLARSLAVEPDVLLLDEPTSSLDQPATLRIEALLRQLGDSVTTVLVTHDLAQAARVSDRTAFLTVELDELTGLPAGHLVEAGPTERLFTAARDPRTEAFLTGRYG